MLRECLLFNTALRGLLPPQSLGVANGIVLHPQLACNITTITLLEHYTSSKLKSSAVTKDHHNNFVSFVLDFDPDPLSSWDLTRSHCPLPQSHLTYP